jgi:predicted ribosomally synthesized peptide with SipW-like signal peptide
MKKRTKGIIVSLCTVAVCGSLIAGTTYALFTSTDSVNIAVTSGNVEFSAEVKDGTLKTYSAIAESNLPDTYDIDENNKVAGGETLSKYATTYYYVEQDEGTFENGGTATLVENQLSLDNVTPGDKVSFDIEVTNKSNVSVQYRTVIECVGDPYLFAELDFTVGEGEDNSFSKVVYYASEWTSLSSQTEESSIATVPITISLPLTADDVFQKRNTVIRYSVEAVQGNASTINEKAEKTTVDFIDGLEDMVKAEDGSYLVTIPQDKDEDEDIVFTDNETFVVIVPVVAVDEDAGYLSFSITKLDEVYEGLDLADNIEATTYDIKLLGIKDDIDAEITISYNIDTNRAGVKVYHYEDLIEDSAYASKTGCVTFKTKSFSPFTITYNKPSQGLEYKLNADEKSYYVSRFGTCTDTEVLIPSTYNGLPVTAIGYRALQAADQRNCKNITSIIIPDTVTSIGEYAFDGCIKLKEIVIPDSVTSIDLKAFIDCESLTNITLPASLQELGGHVFENCTSLTEITIPDGVTKFNNEVFGKCTSLQTVTIGSGLESYDRSVFYDCSSLSVINVSSDNANFKSVDGVLYSKDGTSLIKYGAGKTDTSFTIPDSVTQIDYVSFYGNSHLTRLTIGDNVNFIGNNAFIDCTALTNVVIGNGVTTIKDYAFDYCINLVSVSIGSGLAQIGNAIFEGCVSLTDISVSEKNANFKSVDGNLYSKDGTILIQYAIGKAETAFVIPDWVTTIGDYAFMGSANLSELTIGDSVTSIGYEAFSDSSLTEVTIGNNLTTITGEVFKYCENLVKVVIGKGVTTIGFSAFDECTSLKEVYYLSSESDWHAVVIKNNNDAIEAATVYYYSEANPSAAGNYWHYVDGKVAIWEV